MRIITDAHNEARRLLRERRDSLDELACACLDKEVVEGDELRALLGPVPPKQPDTIPPIVEHPATREA
jgi:ATP-dependent Zn protease